MPVDPTERLFALSPDLMAVLDSDGRFVLTNPAWQTVLGWSEQELSGASWSDFVHPDDRAETERAGELIADGASLREVENRYRTAAGGWRTLLWSGHLQDAHWYCIAKDVTERRELERNSLRDPLTGAANRALLEDRITHALARARRGGDDLALLFIDLDDFKTVNDTYGHAVGDAVLRGAAARLAEVTRAADTVARIGGDEFVVLLEELDPQHIELVSIVSRILEVFSLPLEVAGDRIVIGASIGVVVADHAHQTPAALLRDADVAMYRAKGAGRNCAEIFDAAMREETTLRVRTATDLRVARGRAELRLVFQPLLSLANESVVGCEALVRWQHPSRGLLLPGAFIPIAEDDGTIVSIGEWVLEQACRQGRAWRQEGKDLTVSVNVSARQLVQTEIVTVVDRVLRATGMAAEALCLEITETALLRRPEAAAAALHELRRLGVRIALDDFGDGHSSFTRLKSLPFDVVKIDRSFVAQIDRKPEDRAVVEAVVSLGKAMGMTVIAEGIERPEQVRVLQGLGCPVGQGFLYGQPAPASDLTLDGFLPRGRPGLGDPFVIREFMRQIGIPARIQP